MISKENMVKLIKVEDTIKEIAEAFSEIFGISCSFRGLYGKLDLVNEVIHSNCHPSLQSYEDDIFDRFMDILYDRERTPEERAEILLNGV